MKKNCRAITNGNVQQRPAWQPPADHHDHQEHREPDDLDEERRQHEMDRQDL